MPDVLALPAVVAPHAFGLPLAAHALEPLDSLGVLLAGIGRGEVLLQFDHAAIHVLQGVHIEQLDQISQHAAGAALGLVVLVVGGHAVEVLPHVAIAVDARCPERSSSVPSRVLKSGVPRKRRRLAIWPRMNRFVTEVKPLVSVMKWCTLFARRKWRTICAK